METDRVYCGVLIGEHGFDTEHIIEEIEERIISRGMDFAIINTTFVKQEDMPSHENFVAWAKYLSEREIPFTLVRMAQKAPVGKKSRIERETLLAMREVAGKYFLGDIIAEPGHAYAAKEIGYYMTDSTKVFEAPYLPKTDMKDMAEAEQYYVDTVRRYVDMNAETGMPASLSVEATALSKYNMKAGIRKHILEVPNGDPSVITASVRGAIRTMPDQDPEWGVLIANEWYGGMRHSDMQKRKRLDLISKFSYMSGAGIITLESGDTGIASYNQTYNYDSEICADYRNMLDRITAFAKKDLRPAGGPKVKFGIISGLHDGWCGFCQSSLWNQFGREEFGHSDAEASWRLLEALGTKRKWSDIANYGDNDLSAYPAYGAYDIVPIEASLEGLSKYEYLVFLGWNTMTDENVDKLTEYVRRGGRLLMSAAHLNYNARRDGEFIPPSEEKLMQLCGCRFTGNIIRSNLGTKFDTPSLDERHLYPGTSNFVCDSLYAAGYANYMETDVCGARVLGVASNSFGYPHKAHTTVLENRIGDGLVTLVTSTDYPGNTALTPLYNALFRELVSSSARNCDIRVIASDKLRYTVYEGDKIYLLNTDYDLPITVKIIHNGKETELTLASLELRAVEL